MAGDKGKDGGLESMLFPGVVEDYFKVGSVLGAGRFGEVRQGKCKLSGKKVALKFIEQDEKTQSDAAVINEVRLLRRLGRHPNVLGFLGVYACKSGKSYCIAMELCNGGAFNNYSGFDIFHFCSETEMCAIMFQILSAVDHCHRANVCHCDIKPHNLLSTVRGSIPPTDMLQNRTLKLADFGCALEIRPGTRKVGGGGTPAYMAPERLNKSPFGVASDIWSVGVVMLELLTGVIPFEGNTDSEILRSMKDSQWVNDLKASNRFSEECKSLLLACLTPNPDRRPSAAALLRHPWMMGQCQATAELRDVLVQVRKQAIRSKFVAAIKGLIACNRLSDLAAKVALEQQIIDLMQYDIGISEIHTLSRALFDHASPRGSLHISRAEFLQVMQRSLMLRSPTLPAAAFRSFSSHRRAIERSTIRSGKHMDRATVKELKDKVAVQTGQLAEQLVSAYEKSTRGSSQTLKSPRSPRTLTSGSDSFSFDTASIPEDTGEEDFEVADAGEGSMDEDDEMINHLHFCLSLVTKLPGQEADKLQLAFELFDRQKAGRIDLGGYADMLDAMLVLSGMGDIIGHVEEIAREDFRQAGLREDSTIDVTQFMQLARSNVRLKRYFANLSALATGRKKVFLTELEQLRESKQGWMFMQVRKALKLVWRERFFALRDRDLHMYETYDAFAKNQQPVVVCLDAKAKATLTAADSGANAGRRALRLVVETKKSTLKLEAKSNAVIKVWAEMLAAAGIPVNEDMQAKSHSWGGWF